MKTKLISATLLAATALPMLLASGPASATFAGGIQVTRFVGGNCQPTNASNTAHSQVDRQGRIFNTSPTLPLAVNCPVPRDTFGAKQSQVSVYAIDQKAHVGVALVCTFSMLNPVVGTTHSSSLFGTKDAPSTPSSAEQITSTFLTGLNHANLSCLIPPADANSNKQSGIAGYFVTDIAF